MMNLVLSVALLSSKGREDTRSSGLGRSGPLILQDLYKNPLHPTIFSSAKFATHCLFSLLRALAKPHPKPSSP